MAETFMELAKRRYSVRSFDHAKKVEQEKIDLILEAGIIAPSAKNFQPVRIFVVNNEESITKLQSICPCIYNAPMAFIVCCDKREAVAGMIRDDQNFGEVDAAIAMTHMMLEATELGLGTCWVGRFKEAEVKALMGVPEELTIMSLLPVGYAAADAAPAPRHTERKSREEIVKEI